MTDNNQKKQQQQQNKIQYLHAVTGSKKHKNEGHDSAATFIQLVPLRSRSTSCIIHLWDGFILSSSFFPCKSKITLCSVLLMFIDLYESTLRLLAIQHSVNDEWIENAP